MSTLAIEVAGLHKSFGTTHALDGLDLVVPAGSVAGFLGPNGAGKSTAIRVLLGLLKADGGTVRLLGGDPWTDAVALHSRLAYVPGDVTLWPNLTGGEAIDLLVRLSGRPLDHRRKDQLLQRFELDPTKRARTYSKGNRQKVALVAALATPGVELLVLDEPTSGLDPLMEAVFQRCVREATADGASVLLSSHILAEVEELCDTVTIIRQGKAVQHGTLAELRHLTRARVSTIVAGPTDALATLSGVHDLTTTDGHVTFHVDNDALPQVTRALADLAPTALTITPPSLEELFLREYGDELAALEGTTEPAATR